VFVCENNQYAVTTPTSYATSGAGIAARAAAYGFPGCAIDGMQVQAVMTAAGAAVARARAGEGPSLIECQAYRFQGHFTAERALKLTYRDASEIERWRTLDPVERLAGELEASGALPAVARQAVDVEIDRLIDEAVEFARNSPWPDASEAHQHMYATAYPGLPARGYTWNGN
jgi:pyruvate dehydrogenase E1 component alpha subunit